MVGADLCRKVDLQVPLLYLNAMASVEMEAKVCCISKVL